MSAVEITDLSVRYGRVRALESVSLDIERGTVTALIGANGSGKSTLLNAIIGRTPPTRGSVRVLGLDTLQARRQQRIAFVPQSELVDRRFPVSVHDVVMMGRYGRQGPTRRARAADETAVAAALAETDLGDLQGRQIGALSGGQLKRAFVARALAQEADVLLLDEPFAGVDRASERTISTALRHLADRGRTIFVSSHHLSSLPSFADAGVLLHGGRMLFSGPIAEALVPERVAAAFGLGEQA